MTQSIYGDLYQFSEMSGRMNMPVHQYLLATEPAIMFSTGTSSQAEWILPQIETILGGRPLKYLFISHMESDECGGYRIFQKKYPKIVIITSPFSARELAGFGYKGRVIVGNEGKPLIDGQLSLSFFDYPSEVHLQNGILVMDRGSGVFYSSDLFARDTSDGRVKDGRWTDVLQNIDTVLIPDEKKRLSLMKDLEHADPRFVASGHGVCVRCSSETYR
ncbi:oxygen-binding di-iron domain-containing protein [Methanomethylophilus alvi]|uniref:flavoprotein n=1 Tax=Methanomethylophilus alvi TaxID=1291540 RepID=UPI0037DD8748